MSLFRNERLIIALSPERVALLTAGGGRKGRVERPQVQDLPAEPADASTSGDALWTRSVAALADGLPNMGRGGVTATVLLSNRFVRFAMLPWAESAQRDDAAAALASACLESQYGDMTGWTIRLDDGAYGMPRLACAIENTLLEALRGLFDSRKVASPRIEPYFVTCWNRWRTDIDHGEGLFVVSESGATVIAALKAGHWHGVRALAGAHDREALFTLIARESLLQGFAEAPRCWVHAPAFDAQSLAVAASKAHVVPLGTGDSVSSRSQAEVMAVVGAGA